MSYDTLAKQVAAGTRLENMPNLDLSELIPPSIRPNAPLNVQYRLFLKRVVEKITDSPVGGWGAFVDQPIMDKPEISIFVSATPNEKCVYFNLGIVNERDIASPEFQQTYERLVRATNIYPQAKVIYTVQEGRPGRENFKTFVKDIPRETGILPPVIDAAGVGAEASFDAEAMLASTVRSKKNNQPVTRLMAAMENVSQIIAKGEAKAEHYPEWLTGRSIVQYPFDFTQGNDPNN
jgi:hypothetical protein